MSALDVLCDMLDSSDEEGEPQNGAGAKQDEPQQEKPVHENAGGPAVAEQVVPAEDDDDEDEESEMEAKLKAMQEQMRKMQEELERKKQKKRSLSQVDLFAAPSTSKAGAPKSPVRTNPFQEADRSKLQAKTHLRTEQFGPALPQKVTRTITGGEKERLLEEMMMRDKAKRDAELVRDDLAFDSSEEEEERNPMEKRYNDYGKDIKRIAKAPADLKGQITSFGASKPKVGFNQVEGCTLNLSNEARNKLLPKEVMVEKFSRLRVARPVVASASIEAHMLGKTFVPMSRLREAVLRGETRSGDWTTIGVVFHKASQASKKSGNTFTLWRMTDLQGDIKTVTVMLFGRCHAAHYKVPVNRVVGLLNPKVMEDRAGKGEVTLSVDHPDKVLEIGDSLEVGKCQARKKDGSGCTNLVNRGTCEYCAYHVKKAYQAMSTKRTDLQSAFSGGGDTGVRSRIMGRIDPKGNFFAGGRAVNSFAGGGGGAASSSGVAQRVFTGSQKHRAKDMKSLAELGGVPHSVSRALEAEERQRGALATLSRNGKTTFKSHLSQAERQTVKAVAREVSADLGIKLLAQTPGARGLIKTLSKDKGSPAAVLDGDGKDGEKANVSNAEKSATQLLFEHKKKMAEERRQKVLFEKQMTSVPKLGKGFGGGDFIDLNGKNDSKARAKAMLEAKGKTIESKNPNHVPARKRKAEEMERSKKKVAKALEEKEEKSKENEDAPRVTSSGDVMSRERLAAIVGAKSRNEHLVDEFENETTERRFDVLEKREAMEEKMVNTKELETKAVTCKECNYTSYAQSELCRDRGHRVKRITAMKKFFECRDCKKRTVSLDKYPKTACSKCGGSSWARTGMMREKKGPTLDSERLSIRGVEQKFLGQSINPDDLPL